MKGGTFTQGDQVVAVLEINQHHALAGAQLRSVHAGLLLVARCPDLAARLSTKRKSRTAPAMVSHFGDFWAQARAKDDARATRKIRRSINCGACGYVVHVTVPKNNRS
jgi:hypothetical protein